MGNVSSGNAHSTNGFVSSLSPIKCCNEPMMSYYNLADIGGSLLNLYALNRDLTEVLNTLNIPGIKVVQQLIQTEPTPVVFKLTQPYKSYAVESTAKVLTVSQSSFSGVGIKKGGVYSDVLQLGIKIDSTYRLSIPNTSDLEVCGSPNPLQYILNVVVQKLYSNKNIIYIPNTNPLVYIFANIKGFDYYIKETLPGGFDTIHTYDITIYPIKISNYIDSAAAKSAFATIEKLPIESIQFSSIQNPNGLNNPVNLCKP